MRTTGIGSRRIIGAVAAVLLAAACADQPPALGLGEQDSPAAGAPAYVAVARVIEPGELGLANPAGLAFSPRADMLLVVSRAPGTPPGSATDVALATLAEDWAGAVRIATGLTDPVNMTFDARANRLLAYEASSRQLLEVPADAGGRLVAQRLRRFDAAGFGVRDPRGITVDPASGRLFLLDGAGPRIVSVEPDARLDFAASSVSVIDLAATGGAVLRGLAFDPTSGHLHVLDAGGQVLHELTETGRLVATRDLSRFALRTPQGMTFGPSGDPTDDPSEMSLYVAENGASTAEEGQIVELTFVEPMAVTATATGSLVQTIQTWRFSPPSPDPSGITYASHLGKLVIVDGEVDEMSIYAGANVFEASLSGTLSNTWTTTSFSGEPVGAAYNPANRHLFISDDNKKMVFEIDPGSDGRYRTSDDRLTSFSRSGDPEGVAYDAAHGVLYVADGVGAQVYRISPGANGVFDGTDDAVSSFDTERLGLIDPEGIAYDSDYGHLYIIGEPVNIVFHVTVTGTLVRAIDISAAGADKPAGLEYAPGSRNAGVNSLWIADRVVDNNSDPRENDGRVYEISLPPLSGNSAPTVTITAPANGATFAQGSSITFTGTASDAQDGNLTSGLTWTSSRDGSIGSGGSFSTSGLSVGAHTITASVTDNGGLSGSAAISVTVSSGGGGGTVVDVRVAASSDDAEESATGGMDLTSSDLELVEETSTQTVGMRFNGVTVPDGATITNAYVQFQVDEALSTAASLTVRGQAAENAATFNTATGNVSSRTKTNSQVLWTPPAWSTVGAAGADQRTPNLAGIVQEIVDRPGWASGNSLAIIITGTGRRTAEAYDGVPSAAPLLHVEYATGPSTNVAPTASNVTITGTPQVGQVLTGNYTYSDADGDGEGASTYRWLRNGGAIGGAAAKTYTLAVADQAALIAFEVTPVAATGASPGAAVGSAAVGPVAAAPAVVVTAISPNTVASGTSVGVTIAGSGFAPGASVSLENGSGPAPGVSNVVVQSGGTITATITARSGGPQRGRVWSVRVTNPSGASGVLAGGLTITP